MTFGTESRLLEQLALLEQNRSWGIPMDWQLATNIATIIGGVGASLLIGSLILKRLRWACKHLYGLCFVKYALGPMPKRGLTVSPNEEFVARIAYELEDSRYRRFLGLRLRWFKKPLAIPDFRWTNPKRWGLQEEIDRGVARGEIELLNDDRGDSK